MANELGIALGQTGLTVTAKLVHGNTVSSPISLTEVSGVGGYYIGNMPSTASGTYAVLFYASGVQRAAGSIDWDGTQDVTNLLLKTVILVGTHGTGVRSVTINVNDGVNPIQGAKVNMRVNASVYSSRTDDMGNAVFNPDEGDVTYTIAISAGGYNGLTTTLVVLGDATQAYTLSVLTITQSDTPRVTGYLIARDLAGAPVADVDFELTFVSPPDGDIGNSFIGGYNNATSDSDGLVQFVNVIFPLAGYQYRRLPDGEWITFTASDVTFELPDSQG